MPDTILQSTPSTMHHTRQSDLYRTRAQQVLIAAIVAGIGGNLLLRGGQWRLGFAVWISMLVLSVLLIGGRASRERNLLLAGVALAAFGLAWRDSDMLYALDLLSVLCIGVLLIWQGAGRSLASLTLVHTVRAAVIAAVNTIAGAAGARSRTTTGSGTHSAARTNARALAIGVALAAIPLLLVSALLSASDVVFSRMLDTLVAYGLSDLLVITLLTWITAGWFRAAVGDPASDFVPDPQSPGLPFIMIAVGLYGLLALLALFVATQARVLFGGAAFLRATANLSVANYARDGFFQLILASGAVLVTLVIAEWLLVTEDMRARRQYRLVAAMLLALIALLLVSSAARIALYVNEFGLSSDRAFASAAIVWVFGVLVAFALTTLRGGAPRLMRAAIVVTVAWVILMNVANPEALVVRVNVARVDAGEPFDVMYHAHLSGDALPVLLTHARRLKPADCELLHAGLRTWWTARIAQREKAHGDWRSSDLALVRSLEWYRAGSPLCGNSKSAL